MATLNDAIAPRHPDLISRRSGTLIRCAAGLAAGLALSALCTAPAGPAAAASGLAPRGATAVVAEAAARAFHYQGRLLDANGAPIDGTVNLELQLWNALSGGSSIGDPATFPNLVIEDGLVDVSLPVGDSAFTGAARWLAVKIDDQSLTPRQPILAVPYALGLVPGATVHSEGDGPALQLANFGAGGAISAFSQWGNAVSVASAEGTGLFAATGTVPAILMLGLNAVVAYGEDHGVVAWGGQAAGDFRGGLQGVHATRWSG